MNKVMRWLKTAMLVNVFLVLVGCSSPVKVDEQTENNANALAQAAFNYGQYAKAEAQFLKLLELSPDNLNYQLMLGRTQFRLDKKETAIANLRRVSSADSPVAAEASMYLGRYLLAGSRVAEAVAVYQSGLGKADNDTIKSQLHNGMGVALLDSDRKRAYQALEFAIELSPDNPHFRSNLALSYLHENDIAKAREIFVPLLSYQQLPTQVELNFALLLLAEKKEDQARALLSRHLPPSQVERDLAILRTRLTEA